MTKRDKFLAQMLDEGETKAKSKTKAKVENIKPKKDHVSEEYRNWFEEEKT